MSVSLYSYRTDRVGDYKPDDYKNLFANKQFFELFKSVFKGVFLRNSNFNAVAEYAEIEDITQLSFVASRCNTRESWHKRQKLWSANWYWYGTDVITAKVASDLLANNISDNYFPIPLFEDYIAKTLVNWFAINTNMEVQMAPQPPRPAPPMPAAPISPTPAPWDMPATPPIPSGYAAKAPPPPKPAPWDEPNNYAGMPPNPYRAYQPEEQHFPDQRHLIKGTKTMKESIKDSASTTATTVANVAMGQLGLQALKSAMFTLLPRRFSFWARLTGQHKKVIENPLVIAAAAFGINQVAQHYLKDGTTGAKQVKRLAQSMQDVAALDVLNKYANVPDNVKTLLESGTIPALTTAAPIENTDKE